MDQVAWGVDFSMMDKEEMGGSGFLQVWRDTGVLCYRMPVSTQNTIGNQSARAFLVR